MPNQIDLAQLASAQGLVVRQESDAEMQSRIRREESEHKLRLEKERTTFYVGGTLLVSSLIAAFWLAVSSEDAELKKWAMSLVTLIAGGLIGFVTGKSTK